MAAAAKSRPGSRIASPHLFPFSIGLDLRADAGYKNSMVQVRRSLSMTRLRGCHAADDRGWNPLHVAARKGDLKEVLIQSCPLLSPLLFCYCLLHAI